MKNGFERSTYCMGNLMSSALNQTLFKYKDCKNIYFKYKDWKR